MPTHQSEEHLAVMTRAGVEPASGCMSLGTFLHFSEPQFRHLEKGIHHRDQGTSARIALLTSLH